MCTARENMNRALEHKDCQAPLDFGASCCTGMHISVVEALRAHYGLEKRPVKIDEYMTMLGHIDDDLKDVMGVTVTAFPSQYTTWGNLDQNYRLWKTPWGQEVLAAEGFETTEDERYVYVYACGDKTYPPAGRMPKSGYFFDCISRQKELPDPLVVEDNLEEYAPITEDAIAYLAATADIMRKQDRAVAGNFGGTGLGDPGGICGPSLKDPRGVRDVAEWYITLASEPEFVEELFDRQTDLAIENLKKIYPAVGDSVDFVLLCGTDFGTQISQFCSGATFDRLYKPYYRRITDWIHSNTPWKCAKHCCGSILPLIPNLIDSGFDILNPVQLNAANMDPVVLKREFGKDLVFWGGGVDTQRILPFGSPEDVRNMVFKTLEIFGKDGGFIFSSIHNVQAATPVENIVAMVDAYHEYYR